MIIQVRGTSGSGKSTVMKKVMEYLGEWEKVYRDGRKKPLYYRSDAGVILGHYESPCGGCDTIGSARAVYDLTQEILRENPNQSILQEGLLLSEDVKWTSQLPGVKVAFLDTPLERCLSQIQSRRQAVGNDKPLNPSNTQNRVGVIERARIKLSDLGVECRKCSPEHTPRIILNWLRLSNGSQSQHI